MTKKQQVLVAFSLVFCILLGAWFSVQVRAADVPSLFHNDERWYKDSTARLEMIDGIAYVPVDIFGMFPKIELSMDTRRGEFMLYNRTTGRYISVLYEAKIATVDGVEEIYLNLYRLHGGYYYVPAEYFCTVMGLQWDICKSDAAGSGMTFRIYDTSASLTLAELLAAFDSSDGTDTALPPSSDTQPPVTGGTPERTVYLTFNTIRPAYLSSILQSLRQSGVKATFFFTKAELQLYPELLTAVLPDGHSVALTSGSARDGADFLSQMNEANDILCGIAKFTTRIVQVPKGLTLTAEEAERIRSSGYVLWDYTYDVPDSQGYSAEGVRSVTVSAVRKTARSVLRMSTGETVSRMLPLLLADFRKDSGLYTEPILSALSEVSASYAAES